VAKAIYGLIAVMAVLRVIDGTTWRGAATRNDHLDALAAAWPLTTEQRGSGAPSCLYSWVPKPTLVLLAVFGLLSSSGPSVLALCIRLARRADGTSAPFAS